MARTWIIFDVSSLAHRAAHSTGQLEHDGIPVGVLFGLFRDMRTMADKFQTEDMIFCFDTAGKGLRETEFPSYKLTRRTKKRTPEEEEKRVDMRAQVNRFRTTYLERLGYRNVFYQEGYEADDLIAAAVLNLPKKDTAVLVSGDHDLWQLISDRVSVYHPANKRHVTLKVFQEQWPGLSPKLWKVVKTIAGCSTDDVHGVAGVAEKTAVAYLNKTAKPKTSLIIDKWCQGRQFDGNLKLVSLPYPGTNTNIDLIAHRPPRPEVWGKILKELGMTSLLRRGA